MNKKLLFAIQLFLISFLAALIEPSPTVAQSCSGSYTSSGLYECFRSVVTRQYSCRSNRSETSSCSGSPCRAIVWAPESCSVSSDGSSCSAQNKVDATTSNGCSTSVPPPPPPPPGVPPPPPPPAGSCSGSCFSGLGNCGEVGRPNGSGSCSGGALCCDAPGGGSSPQEGNCDAHFSSFGTRIEQVSPSYNSTRQITIGGPYLPHISLDQQNGNNCSIRYRVGNTAIISFDRLGLVSNFNDSDGECDDEETFENRLRVFAHALGTTTLRMEAQGTGDDGNDFTCSHTVDVLVTLPLPWWQSTNASILSKGDVVSRIPCSAPTCNPYLIYATLGNSPGVVTAGNPSTNRFGLGTASVPNWVAQTTTSAANYTFESIFDQLPGDIVFNRPQGSLNSGVSYRDGYIYSASEGDLIVNAAQNITNKVILLVQGNVTLRNKINITTPGVGFLLIAATGDIIIDPSVGGGVGPHIEGLFLTNQQFVTSPGNTQLHVNGSVVAHGGFLLERDLEDANVDTPAELFSYDPRQILLFPRTLTKTPVVWREVAP
jgi:hypothetical protein